jgi:hypothetical protein
MHITRTTVTHPTYGGTLTLHHTEPATPSRSRRDLFTTDGPNVPTHLAERDDRIRERQDVYEVFSPVDGHAIYRTHSETVAAIVASATPGLDYAPQGAGPVVR